MAVLLISTGHTVSFFCTFFAKVGGGRGFLGIQMEGSSSRHVWAGVSCLL